MFPAYFSDNIVRRPTDIRVNACGFDRDLFVKMVLPEQSLQYRLAHHASTNVCSANKNHMHGMPGLKMWMYSEQEIIQRGEQKINIEVFRLFSGREFVSL
jgi:hypothetical protein